MTIPGAIDVFTIGADGALTLAQSVPSSSFTMSLGPDGSLFAQQLTGEIDSYPVEADGTLGAARTLYAFTQPANMLAISPDGKTLYMDGQNALWFQWTIEADWSLTSLAPGQWVLPARPATRRSSASPWARAMSTSSATTATDSRLRRACTER